MENNAQEMRPTTFEDLVKYKEGALLELPPFGPEQPFFAKVRRPSMLKLVETGKISNSLLLAAEELFTGKAQVKTEKGNMLKDMCDICTVFAKECLVSPTYEEIEKAGVQLADDQLIFLFNYAQDGVKRLNSFRKQSENSAHNLSVESVSKTSK